MCIYTKEIQINVCKERKSLNQAIFRMNSRRSELGFKIHTPTDSIGEAATS